MMTSKILFNNVQITDELDRLLIQYGKVAGIVSPKDYANFYATILAECGKEIKTISENLNYSTEALKVTFNIFKKYPALADKYGRIKGRPANQKMIANIAYSNRGGNGTVDSEDGWKYRGRGLFQITFRDNYIKVDKEITKITGANLDLINNPDVLLTPTGAVLSSLAFWKMNNLQGLDIDKVTDKVNKYTESRAKRKQLAYSIYKSLTGEKYA